MYDKTISDSEPSVDRLAGNTALITSLVAAWNRHDISEILSHFSPDCEYSDQAFRGHLHGHRELGGYFGIVFTKILNHRMTLHETIGNEYAIAYSWECSGRQAPGYHFGKSPTFLIHGISLVEVLDGRIRRQRDRWDVSSYLQQVSEVG